MRTQHNPEDTQIQDWADSNFCGCVQSAPVDPTERGTRQDSAIDLRAGLEVSDFQDTIPTELMELFK